MKIFFFTVMVVEIEFHRLYGVSCVCVRTCVCVRVCGAARGARTLLRPRPYQVGRRRQGSASAPGAVYRREHAPAEPEDNKIRASSTGRDTDTCSDSAPHAQTRTASSDPPETRPPSLLYVRIPGRTDPFRIAAMTSDGSLSVSRRVFLMSRSRPRPCSVFDRRYPDQ